MMQAPIGPTLVTRRFIQRIAVFRALQLGDLLLAIPALRSLRAGFPLAEITLIGLPWANDFAHRFAHLIDRFVSFPGYPGIDEAACSQSHLRAFFGEQRAYGYDLGIQMHGSGLTSNGFVLDLGARLTAGYYEQHRPHGLMWALPYPDTASEIERNLALVHGLGCPDRGAALEFPVGDEDQREAEDLLSGVRSFAGRLVGIHPGARPSARRWPPERFARVADALAKSEGATIVLTGSPDEAPTVRSVIDRMQAPALNLAGQTTLGGLAAVIKQVDLLLSNDTGPAHLAEAVGTPTVRIFGPADPLRWAPLDAGNHRALYAAVPCSPCPYTDCPIDHRCITRIQPGAVTRAVQDLLLPEAVACNA